jgi:serine/threonine protein kinase
MATVELSSARAATAVGLPAASSPANTASAAHADPAPRKLVGRIGPWQLARLISESELTRVYLARPAEAAPESPPAYVVKVLRKEWWRDAHAIELQRRAAWVGQKVSHPNLLPVLSAGVEQPPFYLVSPRLAGRTLAAVLEEKRRLPVAVALWVVRQVAEALDALHATARMIHADVKPANIIVGPDGHATLIDLGFAHAPADARHWSSRPVYGTLNYMAPEGLTSSLAASPQSDVYSLGVTLYESLVGALPFVGRDAEQLVRQHREAQPECIRARRPDTPKAVASLVHRMLAKDPLRRPESAAAVAAELVRLEIECFASR